MAFDVSKINLFTQAQATKRVSSPNGGNTVAFAGQSNSKTGNGNNPYVGVNTNIGVGDTSFTAAQAGIPAGTSRTIAFG